MIQCQYRDLLMIKLVLAIYLTCLQTNLRLDHMQKKKTKYKDKIEFSQSSKKPKEVGQDKEVEILDEPKKVESPKGTRYEFRDKFFSCNEIGHMKRDCTNKSFNHVKDFYCHNFHDMGYNEIVCRKPKYDNDRRYGRISRNTNPTNRVRYNEMTSREGRSYEDRR